MKQLKSTLATILGILFGMNLQAQNFVTGDNLNIGSGNDFGTYGNETYGNVIGIQNSVGGANTLVVGYSDTVAFGSTNSFVAGAHNRVNGINSFAIGGNVKITGNMSSGFGYYLKTGSEKNIVIGMGIKGNNDIPSKYLKNDYQHTLMIGMNSTKPTLTVGPSPNDYPQGDTINKTGKVAIGDVPVPDIAAKLHIRADYGEDAGIFLEPKDMETGSAFLRMRDENHSLSVDNDGVMRLRSMDGINKLPILIDGQIGINVLNPGDLVSDYSLCVYGGVMTTKVTIKEYYHWHDYVFDPDYQLLPLSELKEYVATQRHLPDIPTESEVIANGIEVGEMQGLLVKKIEELTLYTIQLKEQLEALRGELDQLKGNTP